MDRELVSRVNRFSAESYRQTLVWAYSKIKDKNNVVKKIVIVKN